MAAVHILIFGEMAGCNIKPCNMKKKKSILSSNANYMGTISKYIIRKNIAYFHPV